jgi:hypothetical protein
MSNKKAKIPGTVVSSKLHGHGCFQTLDAREPFGT